MLSRNDLLVAWIKRKAESEYRDDIALVLLYGSYVNKTANPLSDIDCYFIPATERGLAFARTFILEGIGIDIFPMSWERVEGLSEFKEAIVPLLGNTEILYCRSEADKARYLELQAKLREHLNDAPYMKKQAHARFADSLQNHDRLMRAVTLSDARLYAGTALLDLADAVAYHNQNYFTRGLKKQVEDLRGFFEKPERFLTTYDEVVRAATPDAVRQAGKRLYEYTSRFLGAPLEHETLPADAAAPVRKLDAAELAEFYQEGVSTFNKIYHNVGTGNAVPAFIAAVCLQRSLAEDCPGLPRFDLLEVFDHRDLKPLAERAKRIETEIVRLIAAGGVRLATYASIEEFLAKN